LPKTLVGLYDADLRCTVAEGTLRGAFARDRIEGQNLADLWPGERAFLREACLAALGGREQVDERRWRGTALSVHAVPITDEKGVTGGMFVVHDVSERRRLEKEVMDIASLEQRRVGQDLHDGLGQMLAGLMCLSGSLARSLGPVSPEHASMADEITHGVRQAMTEVKSLARGLVPVQLDRRGLVSALQELAYDCENLFHVACRCECREGGNPAETAAAAQLYRIAQEAVNNAVRHGRATEIRIVLGAEEGHGHLRIEDNGRGFHPPARSRAGMGLRIMRYRAEMIGGTLTIESRPGRGARVECRYPSSHEARRRREGKLDDGTD
jgi:signal transduction histidine kinase